MNSSIDNQAADWFGRRETGLTPREEAEFQMWLGADPRHAEAFDECDAAWKFLSEDSASSSTPTIVAARPSKRYWLPVAFAAAAIAVGWFVASRPNPALVHYSVSTEAGGLKKIDLPDGSVIHLNGDSAVAIDLTKGERRIALQRGEAFFNVAHDSARPFIVSAAGYAVRAVGTAFNVAVSAHELNVLVTEGKVRVDDVAKGASVLPANSATAETPVLSAGHEIRLSLAPASPAIRTETLAIKVVSEPEAAKTLAWQVRMLDFDNQPLSAVIAEFNRYNQHQLVIVDPELGAKTFGGTFRADNYADLVELLESRYGVVSTPSSGRTELALRR